MTEYDVFVSCSPADRAWVRDELLPYLEEAKLKICVADRDFEIGRPVLDNIEQAVDHSRHTLMILTPAWLKSQRSQFESLLVGTADPAGRQRKLLPLLLKRCKLPPHIHMLTYADFTDPSRRGEEMAHLLRALGATPASAETYQGLATSPLLDSDEQNTYLAIESFAALGDLMQDRDVYTAVVAFQTDFQAASEQIGVLTGYKHQHDLFQQLDNLHRTMQFDQKRLSLGTMDWDVLIYTEPEVRGKIDDLAESAGRPSPPSDETWWMQQLALAKDELRVAVEKCDPAQYKSAIRRLGWVLRRQPSRVNAYLVATARALRLGALVEAMRTVQASLTRLGSELGPVRQFSKGVDALAILDQRLSELVTTHDAWQAIADELQRMEANLTEDTVELESSWPDLRKLTSDCEGSSAADWAMSLKETEVQLESALGLKDLAGVKRLLSRYCSQVCRRFQQVDSDLLALCTKLQKVGEEMDSLLGRIQ